MIRSVEQASLKVPAVIDSAASTVVLPVKPGTDLRSPVLPGLNADPNIVAFGDTYYIYPTTDGFPGWSDTTGTPGHRQSPNATAGTTSTSVSKPRSASP